MTSTPSRDSFSRPDLLGFVSVGVEHVEKSRWHPAWKSVRTSDEKSVPWLTISTSASCPLKKEYILNSPCGFASSIFGIEIVVCFYTVHILIVAWRFRFEDRLSFSGPKLDATYSEGFFFSFTWVGRCMLRKVEVHQFVWEACCYRGSTLIVSKKADFVKKERKNSTPPMHNPIHN